MLNGNHTYSSLPKQTVNLAPPDLHASACSKNRGILHSLSKGKHTGQTKHNFQNILGCVRLFDLVKTMVKKEINSYALLNTMMMLLDHYV